jgi:P4 family phage/plasmid primase-like protien
MRPEKCVMATFLVPPLHRYSIRDVLLTRHDATDTISITALKEVDGRTIATERFCAGVDEAAALIERNYQREDIKAIWSNLQRLKPGSSQRRKETIDSYTSLLIDIDRKNKKDAEGRKVNATDEERKVLFEAANEVAGFLSEFGQPVFADSGNGYHLSWRIGDLGDWRKGIPVEEGQKLYKRLLALLKKKCERPDLNMEIDASLADDTQVVTVWGTYNRKYPDLPGRPQRQSELLSVPGHIEAVLRGDLKHPEVVTAFMIEQILLTNPIGDTPVKEYKPAEGGRKQDKQRANQEWLENYGVPDLIDFWSPEIGYESDSYDKNGEEHHPIAPCPCHMDEDFHEHTHKGDCEIIVFPGGGVGISCFSRDFGLKQVIKKMNEIKGKNYPHLIFEEPDPVEGALDFGAVEAGECSPCIHFGESSHIHTRVESLPKVYTRPTPDFYPVEWSEQKSDKGNAELFARYFGYDILFVPEAGKAGGYYVWNGTHWEHDKGNAAMYHMAKQITGILLIYASQQTTPVKQEEWASYAISCGNAGKLKNMIELVRTHVRTVHKSEFNNQPMLLNLHEGTVDLKTGTILPHDRNDLLTKCQSIPWKPAAECKRWLQFLNEVFEGNQQVIDFIQRAVGYTLTGLTIEEVLFIGWGTGRNGKGKFTDTLIALMGDYARPAKFDMFVAKKGDEGKANDVAELFGARFVPASEGEQSKRLAEAKIKNMVSGDPVEGEKKYQDSFTYYPEYKIWLFTNYKPRIVGTDEGIWDKVIFIPFKRYFEPHERDKNLLAKLKQELPGILQWAIRGCLDWQEQGLNVPECLKQATAEYRSEQNVLGHFVEEELVTNDKLKAPCGQMYEHYKSWTDKNGEYQMTATEFKERMEQRYGEAGRSAEGKFWKGVGIKILLSEQDKWMLEKKTVEEMVSAIQ